jgi:hypothetical protein
MPDNSVIRITNQTGHPADTVVTLVQDTPINPTVPIICAYPIYIKIDADGVFALLNIPIGQIDLNAESIPPRG